MFCKFWETSKNSPFASAPVAESKVVEVPAGSNQLVAGRNIVAAAAAGEFFLLNLKILL